VKKRAFGVVPLAALKQFLHTGGFGYWLWHRAVDSMRRIAAACHDEFKIFAIKIVELDSVFRPPEGVEDVKQMQTLFEVKFYSSKYGFDLHFLHCERTTDHNSNFG
jgi:hypothetical protein